MAGRSRKRKDNLRNHRILRRTGESKHPIPNTDIETPNTKLQTPEKSQIASSKAATSRAELGFGAWDFFGVWSLVFGVFILAMAGRSGTAATPSPWWKGNLHTHSL